MLPLWRSRTYWTLLPQQTPRSSTSGQSGGSSSLSFRRVGKRDVPGVSCGTQLGQDGCVATSGPGPLQVSAMALKVPERELSQSNNAQFVLPCTVSNNEISISTSCMIDSGATGFAFMDEDFATRHNLEKHPLDLPRELEAIDGRPVASGRITHAVRARINLEPHVDEIWFFLTSLGHFPVVLGIPWLRLHDPKINFKENRITFDSGYCIGRCIEQPVITSALAVPDRLNNAAVPLAMVGAAAFVKIAKDKSTCLYAVT